MRLSRELSELHARLRLHCTGSKDDVRQNYLQGLLTMLADPIICQGSAGIPTVIEAMDEYMLVPEDRDTVVELDLDGKYEAALKKVPAQVKSAFTRTYNAGNQFVIVLTLVLWCSNKRCQVDGPEKSARQTSRIPKMPMGCVNY